MTISPWELPDAGPTGVGEVKAHLGITDDHDDTRLGSIVAAVNAQVRGWPISHTAHGLTQWPANVIEGATMLAARLFRRKNSPAGVESFGELGAVYVQRNDPDIAMLLGIGAWAPPAVG